MVFGDRDNKSHPRARGRDASNEEIRGSNQVIQQPNQTIVDLHNEQDMHKKEMDEQGKALRWQHEETETANAKKEATIEKLNQELEDLQVKMEGNEDDIKQRMKHQTIVG